MSDFPLDWEFFVGRDSVHHSLYPQSLAKEGSLFVMFAFMCCSPTAKLGFYKPQEEFCTVHFFL